MQIGMTSKDHSLIEMSMMAYWTIRARLLRVPGVANVAHLGRAAADDDGAGRAGRRCRRTTSSLDSVMEATADSVDSGPAAVLHRLGHRHRRRRSTPPNQRLGVRHVLPIVTPADLARVTGRADAGRRPTVPLGDVGRRRQGGPPAARSATRSSTTGPGCCWSSRSCRGATPCSVTQGVEEAINDAEARAARTSSSTPRSSGRPTSSRPRSTTSPRRCCWASCWWW